MTSEEKIKSYLPLVDFLADITGPYAEVVLLDVRDREHSVVAIRNGQLSGREVGAPMTDFAAQVLKRGRTGGKDFITNYLGKAGGAGKFLKSSTYFIRDDDGEIIGMLGINSDLSPFWEVQQIMGQFLAVEDTVGGDEGGEAPEEQRPSVSDMVRSVMEEVLNSYPSDAARMTTDEKKEIVEELNDKGVFLLKGTVAEVAQRLDVSEQTVYRYLKNF